LVGVNVFDPVDEPPVAAETTNTPTEPAAEDRATRLYLKTQLTEAEGEDQSRGFLVLVGAVGRSERMVMMPSYEQLRDKLMQEGILVAEGAHVRLVRSHLFDSPSAAAREDTPSRRADDLGTCWCELGIAAGRPQKRAPPPPRDAQATSGGDVASAVCAEARRSAFDDTRRRPGVHVPAREAQHCVTQLFCRVWRSRCGS
jgi:hypothetical protein